MPTLEIVSHPLCPMTHRLRMITARAPAAPGKVAFTYLPYADFPTTIRRYHPGGGSPVLMLDERPASATTEVIGEYLDSVLGLGSLPAAPADRLGVREREALASDALQTLRGVFTARDAQGLRASLDTLFHKLGAAEAAGVFDAIDPGGGLLDAAAWAGVFALLHDHPALPALPEWTGLPRAAALGRGLAAREDVRAARCENPLGEFDAFFAMTGSRFAALIGTA